jgi:phosphatidylserine/phosphatidylglycerophosphate/cardiolipin synthase-like enzyme
VHYFKQIRWGVGIASALGVFSLLVWLGKSSVRVTALPQDPDLQVYMNQNQATAYRDPYRQIQRPGEDLEAVIIQAIARAKTSVDVAVQEIRLPKIAHVLRDRYRAGVKVRVVIENEYARPYSSYSADEGAQLPPREKTRYDDNLRLIDTNGDGTITPAEVRDRDALVVLSDAGIPVLNDTADGSAGSGLMHHKFVVIDGQQVIVTSANFTLSDMHGDMTRPASRGNANNLLVINSPQLAQVMTQEVEALWGNGGQTSRFGDRKGYRAPVTIPVGRGTLTVKFSPDSRQTPWNDTSNGLIGQTLAQAKRSVNLALFVFSEQMLADRLQEDHQRGVVIRALIDPEFAYQPYSEALDLMGVAILPKRSCRGEAQNRPWQNPIQTVGVPKLPPGDKLHHKFGVLDGETVITGSHNWSAAANTLNDETLIVVHNAIAAAHYEREFERLYTNSVLGVPPSLHRRVEQQKQRCRS